MCAGPAYVAARFSVVVDPRSRLVSLRRCSRASGHIAQRSSHEVFDEFGRGLRAHRAALGRAWMGGLVALAMLARCGDSAAPEPVCTEGETRSLICGETGEGLLEQTCLDGEWQNTGACVEPVCDPGGGPRRALRGRRGRAPARALRRDRAVDERRRLLRARVRGRRCAEPRLRPARRRGHAPALRRGDAPLGEWRRMRLPAGQGLRRARAGVHRGGRGLRSGGRALRRRRGHGGGSLPPLRQRPAPRGVRAERRGDALPAGGLDRSLRGRVPDARRPRRLVRRRGARARRLEADRAAGPSRALHPSGRRDHAGRDRGPRRP